jgi:(R,R)-butanediol dehydrogenase/meso-butanediol dehydrogenase/diacetyl reductase
MKALSLVTKGQVKLVDMPRPEPEPGQVLIRVAYAGICGSDLSILGGKHPRAKPPLVMGHEFSGTVARIPDTGAKALAVGDAVTVYPLLSCGECYVCEMGLPHVCRDLRLLGIDTHGAFAEYVLADQSAVLKLPEQLSARVAALVEPLAVCIHAARMSRLQVGDAVVVTGAGPIGLLMAQVAHAAGAGQVIVTEVAPARIEGARNMGLMVLDASDAEYASQVIELTGGRGGDIVFEATGHPTVTADLMRLVRIRGQIVQVGIFKEPVPLDLRTLNFHEVELVGSRVYTKQDFAAAIELAASGKLDLEACISHVLPLSGGAEGFVAAGSAESLKVLFEIG